MSNSNYFKFPELDIYTKERNAYLYTGSNTIIAHPPCQQWSRLKGFAHENKMEKDLALYCYEKVLTNGGILEHPNGSSFFKYVNADRKKMFVVWQSWFGYPAKKPTILFCQNVQLLPPPINFNAIEKTVDKIAYRKRSLMPLTMCKYLLDSCINQ